MTFTTTILRGNEKASVKTGLVIASENAFVECIDFKENGEPCDATIILLDKARCNAGGNSHVTARGKATVNLFDEAQADVYDEVKVSAHHSSTFTARDRAHVTALGGSGFLFGWATYDGYGVSRAEIFSSGEVRLHDKFASVHYTPLASGIDLKLTGQSLEYIHSVVRQVGRDAPSGVTSAQKRTMQLFSQQTSVSSVDDTIRQLILPRNNFLAVPGLTELIHRLGLQDTFKVPAPRRIEDV